MKKTLVAIIIIISCFELSAFDIKLQGLVYFKGNKYVAANESLVCYVNGKMQGDTVVTSFVGQFSISLIGTDDTTNLVEIFALDCGLPYDADPVFMDVFYAEENRYGIPLEICSEPYDPCEPYFSADSIDEQTLQFNDSTIGNINSWYWEFGDGYSSTEQNPQHFYFAPGSYLVRLQAKTVDNTFCELEDSVFVEKTEHIFGEALLKAAALDSGDVYSYYYDHSYSWFNPENSIIDTLYTIENGRFKVPRKKEVSTIVQVVPTFVNSDEYYPVYFPTYYNGSFYWDDSKYFQSYRNDSLNISMLKRDGVFYGYGSIKGNIVITDLLLTNRVCVFLLDSEAKQPLKYTYLEVDGTFNFNHVPMGNYNIFVDALGFEAVPIYIELFKEKPDKQIEFALGDLNYTSVEKHVVEANEIKVFPNPFVNSIRVETYGYGIQDIPFDIVSSSGSTVYSIMLDAGVNEIELDLDFLAPGIYILRTPRQAVKIQKTY